jgi:hypothetical protein
MPKLGTSAIVHDTDVYLEYEITEDHREAVLLGVYVVDDPQNIIEICKADFINLCEEAVGVDSILKGLIVRN